MISQGALKKFSQPFNSAEPSWMQTEVIMDKSSKGSLSKSQDVLHFCTTITPSQSLPPLSLVVKMELLQSEVAVGAVSHLQANPLLWKCSLRAKGIRSTLLLKAFCINTFFLKPWYIVCQQSTYIYLSNERTLFEKKSERNVVIFWVSIWCLSEWYLVSVCVEFQSKFSL